ncbi:hypothetical protein [Streptomyces sp. gCLA4]|uniref:hypothetical protein n=1 Tax=Streptomyces sp. gCLA4 TaxID=1873416 RepID=UPI0015FF923D|nr:hypothetical protein [Streptomyces sp. gCLA4]
MAEDEAPQRRVPDDQKAELRARFEALRKHRRQVLRESLRPKELPSPSSRPYINAAGDLIEPGDFDAFEGYDPDEDPELWG